MRRGEGACLVCGKPVVYYPEARRMECVFCHKTFESYAGCEDGHYVCDECYGAKGISVIMEGCGNVVNLCISSYNKKKKRLSRVKKQDSR